MLRFVLVLSLICVFAVAAICAIACPEESIATDHPEKSHECTKCISIHFVSESKTLSLQLPEFSHCQGLVQSQFQLEPSIESFAFESPPENNLLFCPVATSVFRI